MSTKRAKQPEASSYSRRPWLKHYDFWVPTLFISWLNHPDARRAGVDRIRRFNNGSAPLPLDVIEQIERMSGALLYEGYGMTEAVQEVAVIGVPCAYRGEAVKAFIVLKPDLAAAAEELIEHCRARLAR